MNTCAICGQPITIGVQHGSLQECIKALERELAALEQRRDRLIRQQTSKYSVANICLRIIQGLPVRGQRSIDSTNITPGLVIDYVLNEIEEARKAELERACAAVCELCREGHEVFQAGNRDMWWHKLNTEFRSKKCKAAAIRAGGDDADAG